MALNPDITNLRPAVPLEGPAGAAAPPITGAARKAFNAVCAKNMLPNYPPSISQLGGKDPALLERLQNRTDRQPASTGAKVWLGLAAMQAASLAMVIVFAKAMAVAAVVGGVGAGLAFGGWILLAAAGLAMLCYCASQYCQASARPELQKKVVVDCLKDLVNVHYNKKIEECCQERNEAIKEVENQKQEAMNKTKHPGGNYQNYIEAQKKVGEPFDREIEKIRNECYKVVYALGNNKAQFLYKDHYSNWEPAKNLKTELTADLREYERLNPKSWFSLLSMPLEIVTLGWVSGASVKAPILHIKEKLS